MAQESRPIDALEVELKYSVSDFQMIRAALERLGALGASLDWETDIYYAAPNRPFEQTDEALRLRRSRDRLWLTYKGPRLDPHSKSRREVEVELHSSAFFDQAGILLEHLGYFPITSLYKERTRFHLPWEGYEVTVSLDNVHQVGTFVELETRVPETKLAEARRALARLAASLGLKDPERRSYLELYWDRLHQLPPNDLGPFV
ncbi:MAG: class IV adenylate cyclase [Gemmatales bacterium]|nr:class IV adenylate cyclase [Gemmatales bacterium]MCS7160083.1 class IV adenylate cyclase [Gemmatales bacterium]MDW8175283.1 class IV adenylate cyclase [Gemmatales bacterium]MDW8222841.1 class IV adenylate cyclase [Gemmatales bacterium]